MLTPQFAAIPNELRTRARWVTWKGRKIPYCAEAINSFASVTDPDTWSSFQSAQNAYEEGGREGIGFVLNGDGVAGVDIDNCVFAGQPDPAALSLMQKIGCRYIELSPSATGLRGFGYADNIKGKHGLLEGVRVELYTNQRYLTVTGHALVNGPLVNLEGFQGVANAIEQKKRSRTPQKPSEDQQRPTDSHLPLTLLSSVGCPSTTPLHEGQRNRCLFELARQVKAQLPNASTLERRSLVQAWHSVHYAVIGTKALSVSLDDFERAWIAIKYLPGETLQEALRGVDLKARLSPSLAALGYSEYDMPLLNICLALQAHAGQEPFFLGARKAAELLGHADHSTAAAMLRTFVRDGVLKEISKGIGKKASRYRMKGAT